MKKVLYQHNAVFLSLAVSTILFAITVLTRLPFRSKILYHWDSVQFALATEHFDIRLHQPQPPGYIVYVALGKLLNYLTHDPQISFVWLSILLSALTVVLILSLAKAIYGQACGIISSLFLLVSPLFWFFGEIALPHTADAFLVTLTALLAYKVMRGQEKHVLTLAIAFALATGVRQQNVAFMLPLCILALQKTSPKVVLISAVVFAILCLMWFVPAAELSGGVIEYQEAVVEYSRAFLSPTSLLHGAGIKGPLINSYRLVLHTAYALGLAGFPLTYYVIKRLKDWPTTLQDDKFLFLLIWMLPSLLFYSLIHMGNQGLVFVFLPALLIMSAKGLLDIYPKRVRLPVRDILTSVGAIIVLNAAIFIASPQYLAGDSGLQVLNWSTIKSLDAYYEEKIRAILENFRPKETVILAIAFRHASYYLPEYRVFWTPIVTSTSLNSSRIVHASHHRQYRILDSWDSSLVPENTRFVVLFDEELNQFNRSPMASRELAGLREGNVYYLVLQKGESIACGPGFLEVVGRQ